MGAKTNISVPIGRQGQQLATLGSFRSIALPVPGGAGDAGDAEGGTVKWGGENY